MAIKNLQTNYERQKADRNRTRLLAGVVIAVLIIAALMLGLCSDEAP